jgi:hypothetical protein
MPFVVASFSLIVIAYAVLYCLAGEVTHHIAACYTMVCFSCMGFYPLQPCHHSWVMNNMAGAAKRSVGIAFIITVMGFSGIVSSFMYRDSEAPGYKTGFGTAVGMACWGIVAALLLEVLYLRHNRRYAHMSEKEAIDLLGREELDRLGDKSPLFKYTL